MKKLIIFVILLISNTIQAEMPDYLKGGLIEIKLKNGRTYIFNSEKVKLVFRKKIIKKEATKITKKEVKRVEMSKNSYKVFTGVGPEGFELEKGKGQFLVKPKPSLIYGFGYERRVNNHFGIEAIYLSNQTGIVGFNFYFK